MTQKSDPLYLYFPYAIKDSEKATLKEAVGSLPQVHIVYQIHWGSSAVVNASLPAPVTALPATVNQPGPLGPVILSEDEQNGDVGAAKEGKKSHHVMKTLSSGEAMLRDMLKDKKPLSGADVFKLYDTYGFPSDLTKEIALESGVSVDMDGFSKLMVYQSGYLLGFGVALVLFFSREWIERKTKRWRPFYSSSLLYAMLLPVSLSSGDGLHVGAW